MILNSGNVRGIVVVIVIIIMSTILMNVGISEYLGVGRKVVCLGVFLFVLCVWVLFVCLSLKKLFTALIEVRLAVNPPSRSGGKTMRQPLQMRILINFYLITQI